MSQDPLPALIADQIVGLRRIPNSNNDADANWVRLSAETTNDGRTITVTAEWLDMSTSGDYVTKTLMHLTEPIPIDQAPCAGMNGQVDDPVINVPHEPDDTE